MEAQTKNQTPLTQDELQMLLTQLQQAQPGPIVPMNQPAPQMADPQDRAHLPQLQGAMQGAIARQVQNLPSRQLVRQIPDPMPVGVKQDLLPIYILLGLFGALAAIPMIGGLMLANGPREQEKHLTDTIAAMGMKAMEQRPSVTCISLFCGGMGEAVQQAQPQQPQPQQPQQFTPVAQQQQPIDPAQYQAWLQHWQGFSEADIRYHQHLVQANPGMCSTPGYCEALNQVASQYPLPSEPIQQ